VRVDPSFSAKLPTVAWQDSVYKPEANVSCVGVGVLRNEPALREPSPVASACEQSDSDFGIASLFECAMPSANSYDLDSLSRMWIRLSYIITLCLLMLRHPCRLSLLSCHL